MTTPPALSHGPEYRPLPDDPETMTAALIRAAERHPERGMSFDTGERLTHPELLDRALRVLTGLREVGISAGDTVVLQIAGGREFYPVLWACLLGGILPAVPPRPASRTPGDPGFGKLELTAETLGTVTFLAGEPDAGELSRARPDWRVLSTAGLEEHEPAGPPTPPNPSTVALYLLSSGSTGRAKVIPLTHDGLVRLAHGVREELSVRPGDVLMNWMPLDGSGGLLMFPLSGVWLGTDTVHADTAAILASPERWIDLMATHRVTHAWAPNFALRRTADALREAPDGRWDLGELRLLASGGEQIMPGTATDVLDRLTRFGARPVFSPVWGMTETTTAICYSRGGPPHRLRPSTLSGAIEDAGPGEDAVAYFGVGRPAPGTSFRIVGPDGETLAENRIGRLQVRSPRITPGYLGEHTPIDDEGWFDTGDLGFLRDGELVFTGRAKDLLIINGHNHFCHEIEEAAAVPGASAVAACGVPNDRTGTEDLVLFYVPAPGHEPGAVGEAMRAAVGERLRLPVARTIAVAEADFPRTSTGKIQRSRLLERFPSKGFEDTDPFADLDPARPFFEQGLGSADLIALAAKLSARLGRAVPVTELYAHPTVEALTAHLGAPSAAAPITRSTVEDRRVAVIGLAGRFPGAADVDAFWANLLAGVESIRHFTPEELDAPPGTVPAAGVLSDVDAFDHGFFGMTPKESALTDPQHRLFAEVVQHALEHAGYASTGARVGLYAGAGMNLLPHHTYLRANLRETVDGGDPLDAIGAAIGNQPDFLATRIAYRLGLTGPAIGVQTACSTSLVAVHLAARALLAGDAEIAVAGASAVHIPQVTAYPYAEGLINSPAGHCRPFDAEADGTVGGSGVAAVVLKPYAKAVADGDTVHGVILGTAVNNDGAAKVGFTAPGKAGQAEVLRLALADAGVPADSVGYVETHGTGTPVGDPIEVAALAEVYPPGTVLSSVKANIGHLDSAAGMAGLIKALLVLRHGRIPRQINYSRPNPALGLADNGFQIPAKGELDWPSADTPRRAAVTALGVGGTNAHVILEEAPPTTASIEDGPAVLTLSAADPEALIELAASFADFLRANPVASADLTTGTAARRRHRHRIAVAAEPAGLPAVLAAAVPGEPVSGPAAFLFTGQGARFGPVLELERFPSFAAAIDEAAEVFPELRAHLAAPASHWDTDVAQPVLTALQCALTALWAELGVRPALTAGHSAGEFAALAAAGALSTADAVRLAAVRGRLMRERSPEGAMLAVQATPVEIAALMSAAPGVAVSVENGPGRYVLGGSADAVADAERIAETRGMAARRLPVRRAFHTSLMDPVLPELASAAERIGFRPVTVPFVSGVDGQTRPAGWTPDADYLLRQTREPVRFGRVLDALGPAGVRLEIGPEAVLTGLGRRHDPARPWISSLRMGTGERQAIAEAVAALFTVGVEVDWTVFAPGRRVPLPLYPYRKHRHWVEPVARVSGDVLKENLVEPVKETEIAVSGAVLDRVREITAELLGVAVDLVAADAEFSALGADSLSLVNLTRRLDGEYGVRVAVRELFEERTTPRAVAAAVAERGGRVEVETVPIPASAAVPVVEAAPIAVPEPVAPVVVEPEPGGALTAIVERQLSIMEEQLRLLRGETRPAAPARAAASVPEIPEVAEAEPVATEGPSTLDFGLYFFGDYPEGRADGYRVVLDSAAFADSHGFSSVWLPERHFHSFGGVFPNPSVLAAAVAARTSRVRINAGSVVLPLHHPVRVAEEWSIVDNLSGGRAGIGIASGWHADDFVFAPGNFGRHREIMYEHLDTVRRLWSGEAVKTLSGSGKDTEVRLFPRPVQEKPPMFTAIVGNPDSYRQAAAHDLGVVTNLMAQDIPTLAGNIALYRAERARLGKDAGRVVVLVHTHLGPDAETARAQAFEPFCAYLRSSLSLLGQVANSLGMNIDMAATPEEDLRFLLGRAYERYCAERALIGSPESVAGVAEAIRAAGADEIAAFVDFGLPAGDVAAGLPHLDSLRRRFLVTDAPLSPGQRRLWTVDRLRPGGTGLNEAVAIRLTGDLDVPALRRALRGLVDRHEPLRTVYRENAQGEPRQVVIPSLPVELPVTEHDDEAAAVAVAMEEEGRRVFDLTEGPVFAFRLLRVPGAHVLVLCFHHIAADGGSYAVLGPEVSALYRGETLPPLPITYTQVAREDPAQDPSHWREVLAEPPAPLALPAARPRPSRVTDAGATYFHPVPAGLFDRSAAFAREHRGTPFAVLLAGMAAAAHLMTGREDLVLATGMSGRDDRTIGLFGFFTQTVPLRIGLGGRPGLAELSRRVRDRVADAGDNPAPFDAIVRTVNPPRVPGHTPFLDLAVEFSGGDLFALDLPGVCAERLPVGPAKAAADIVVYLSRGDWQVEYRTDVYTEAEARAWLDRAITVLERGIAEPDAPLGEAAPTLVRPDGAPEDVLRTVREAVAEELGLAEVPADRSFFTLGGHSIAAIRLANRLRERGLDADASAVFATGTIGELAAALAGDVEETAPLSHQQEYWLAEIERTGDPAGRQIGLRLDLGERTDPRRLAEAVDALVARHPALRTRYRDGRQEVLRHRPVVLEPASGNVEDWCAEFVARPLPLDGPTPPFAAGLARTGDGWTLVLSFTHLNGDGWTADNLLRDLAALYQGPLPPMGPTYARYAAGQRAEEPGSQFAGFWRERLRGLPRWLLPTDRPRTGPTGVPETFTFEPAPPVTRAHVTAAYGLLVAALTGEEEIVVRTQTAHRLERWQEPLAGLFTTGLPVRLDVRADGDFASLVRHADRSFVEGLSHARTEPEIMRAVDPDWRPGHPRPWSQASLVLNTRPVAVEIAGAPVRVTEPRPETPGTEFTLGVVTGDGRVDGVVEYAPELFDRSTVARWVEALTAVLDTGLRAPGTPVKELLGVMGDLLT